MGTVLFGYTKLYGQVPGGPAEFLRVPHPLRADQSARRPPEGRFVSLSDVLPTAWQAVEYAAVPRNGWLELLGLGPTGDMATRVARQQGIEQVIGVDPVVVRLGPAQVRGIHTVDLDRAGAGVVAVVRHLTSGRGADSFMDAVGMEAHGAPMAKAAHGMTALPPNRLAEKVMRRAGTDRVTASQPTVEPVRRGGTMSLSGVYGGMAAPLALVTLFDKQIRLRMAQANVRRWIDDLLPLAAADDPLGVDTCATHLLALTNALAAYDMFQKKLDGAVKIVFRL
jgi:threonine dehydrogenase-like Zn-dependent dehydrogenase